jgi:hypothetical protein
MRGGWLPHPSFVYSRINKNKGNKGHEKAKQTEH